MSVFAVNYKVWANVLDFTIMFWFGNTSSSQIEVVLCKEDITLQELMDEEDIINECKTQNKALIEYLSKPEVMQELVTLTTVEPSPNLDERMRFKYPNIACELLTCDVPALNERLASDEILLDKLYTFLDCEPPLNPLLASFFSKIMGVLIAKKTEQNWLSYQLTCLQVLDFLKAKDNFITLLLKHLSTSAIMDLTLKLMTEVDGVEMRQNILNWLDSQRIMQSLVSLFDPDIDKERHYNVAQLLCDFIKCSRDMQKNSMERADPDPLLNTIESPETVTLLLDHILKDKCETAIVGGIQVLLALLDVNRNSIQKYEFQNIYNSSSYDDGNDLEQKQVVQNIVQVLEKRLPDFHNLLLNPPKRAPIQTTVGLLNQPLGNTRLQIIKLFAAIISTNCESLVKELINLNTLEVLLDLFFQYPWNNFLHTQVEICITSALKTTMPQELGDTNALCKHLLVSCDLINRILNAWKENDDQQSTAKGVRQGYMGHLINIVNKLVQLCSTTPLGQFLKENLPDSSESLEKFNETVLQDIIKTQETLLGGVHPNTSNENSDEYGSIAFSQAGHLQQQMFSQYQIQQVTPQYIENYGFQDDDFNDGDDTLQTIDHRTNMNFDLSDNDVSQSNEIFKQLCAQNINTLDDADDQIFEERDHTFETVIEKHGNDQHDATYSSDSDDESPPPIDTIDPWTSEKCSLDASNVEDPWKTLNSNANNGTSGWADFSSACFADFDNSSSSTKIKVDEGSLNETSTFKAVSLDEIKSDTKEDVNEATQEKQDLVKFITEESNGDGNMKTPNSDNTQESLCLVEKSSGQMGEEKVTNISDSMEGKNV